MVFSSFNRCLNSPNSIVVLIMNLFEENLIDSKHTFQSEVVRLLFSSVSYAAAYNRVNCLQ